MIVEDDAASLDAVCELLEMLGHQVSKAANAAQAKDRLNGGVFDVIVTDVSLPGLSGISLAQQAVAAHPDLKVVFASGDELPNGTLLDFPYKTLRKPFSVDELKEALSC